MIQSHCRNRSLISVKDIDRAERKAKHSFMSIPQSLKDGAEEEEEEEHDKTTPRQRSKLIMIYLLFLVEAIMDSSLPSQVSVLTPSTDDCLAMDTAFLRSILQCSYSFGSALGVFWGFTADRWGRRKVALTGLSGVFLCCFCMGLATGFAALVALRCVAGALGSAVTVSGLAMLTDVTHGSKRRIHVVAALPLVVICGHIGSLIPVVFRNLAMSRSSDTSAEYSSRAGQVICALIILSITVAEIFLLPETLAKTFEKQASKGKTVDCEKAAFLGQPSTNDSNESLNISIMKALSDDNAAPLQSGISVAQMISAPSVRTLLISFSLLSLHSATFEVLLPHLGHTPTHNAGMGIPCSWLEPVIFLVQTLAAWRVMLLVPKLVARVGLLSSCRKISIVFPVLYIVIPAVALAVYASGTSNAFSIILSMLATLAKDVLADAAKVLMLLLALSTASDALSTGTLLGVLSISELFKALAVGVAGMSYYLSDAYSLFTLNSSLWVCLTLVAAVGAAITQSLREKTYVGTDIPEECLVWQGIFDVESDNEPEF